MDRLFTVNRSSKSDVYILNIVHFSDRISYKIFLLSYSYTIFHQATPIFPNFGSLRKIVIVERLYCLVMSTQVFYSTWVLLTYANALISTFLNLQRDLQPRPGLTTLSCFRLRFGTNHLQWKQHFTLSRPTVISVSIYNRALCI